jgi:hypothetical protein
MRLSETEQSMLLNHFPNVELSYETMVHKKVYSSDFVLAIPGMKWLWKKMYIVEDERLEKEMDIINILKSLRKLEFVSNQIY